MAEKNSGLSGLVVLAALLACATPSPERLLDHSCQNQQCPTSGSARQTTGLTADSVGFELGPGPGSVTIAMANPERFSEQVELLVRGQGSLAVTIEHPSCAPNCGALAIELREQWHWASVGRNTSGTDFKLVIETLDQTSTAALLDFRMR